MRAHEPAADFSIGDQKEAVDEKNLAPFFDGGETGIDQYLPAARARPRFIAFRVPLVPGLLNVCSRATGRALTIGGFLGRLTLWPLKVENLFGEDRCNFVSFRFSPLPGLTGASPVTIEELVRAGFLVVPRFTIEGIAPWVFTPWFGRSCPPHGFRGWSGAAFPGRGLFITLADFAPPWLREAIA